MKSCNHPQWLNLHSQGHQTVLLESGRLRALLRDIDDPHNASTNFLLFIGDRSKSEVLRKLFGIKQRRVFRRKHFIGDIDLHLTKPSQYSAKPTLIADGSLTSRTIRKKTLHHNCHDGNKWPLKQDAGSNLQDVEYIERLLCGRLLLPFSDVICFFASDIGGFQTVARHLSTFLRCHSTSNPCFTKPSVVIVTDKVPPIKQREEEAKKALLWLVEEETSGNLFDIISTLDVVALPSRRGRCSQIHCDRLKVLLQKRSAMVQKQRVAKFTLFSLVHFTAFFEAACSHFAEWSEEPFDFIKASRLLHPATPQLEKHLRHFLNFCETPQDLLEFASPVLASSFMLDSYPPGCHPFNPEDIFQALYKGALSNALGSRVIAFDTSPDIILRTGVLKRVERYLKADFQQRYSESEESTAYLHMTTMGRYKDKWKNIHTDSSCFYCLRDDPQYSLPCGHFICENCVQIFGQSRPGEPYTFRISSCFLCGEAWAKEIVVRIKSPTSGVGILCVDGGGVRGVIPLTFLNRIEKRIGLPIPLQRYFKIFAGVSSGSFTGLAMYQKGWPVEKCLEMFLELAETAFSAEKTQLSSHAHWISKLHGAMKLAKTPFKLGDNISIPALSWISKLFRLYTRDAIYDPDKLESILKSLLGPDTTMLDCSYATELGAKLCLLVATVLKKPSCRLFTNYNGKGKRSEGQSKADSDESKTFSYDLLEAGIITPEEGGAKALIWEV